MKIHFRKHDAHQAFMDSDEARSAADTLLYALGQDEFGIECDDCTTRTTMLQTRRANA